MVGLIIFLILVCVVVLAAILSYLSVQNKITGEWMAAILITVAVLVALCLVAGGVANEPKYFYEGMRVEKEDIDFSEFIMTYDEEKNHYNLEKKGE